jgi:hypothetical protein
MVTTRGFSGHRSFRQKAFLLEDKVIKTIHSRLALLVVLLATAGVCSAADANPARDTQVNVTRAPVVVAQATPQSPSAPGAAAKAAKGGLTTMQMIGLASVVIVVGAVILQDEEESSSPTGTTGTTGTR